MDRKIIARFPSLLEAEAALSCLEAAEIPALIDDRLTANLMPHASDAFGGFTVSVPEADEARAKELLGSIEDPPPAEPPSADRETDLTMRRATYGAVLGAIFLPLIANLFSLALYGKAYSRNPNRFWQRKWLFAFGMFFNALVFGAAMFAAGVILTSKKEIDSYGTCYIEGAPPATRIKDCAARAGYAEDSRGRASALGTMGILHARLGNFHEAISAFTQVLNGDPTSAPAHADRAMAYALAGDIPNAFRDLGDAIKLDATDPGPLSNRCFLKALGGKPAEALPDCDAAAKLARESRDHAGQLQEILDIRGYAHFKAGQLDAAKADFSEALKHNSRLATSLYGRGLVERQQNNAGSAENDINSALAIDADAEKNFDSIGHIGQRL